MHNRIILFYHRAGTRSGHALNPFYHILEADTIISALIYNIYTRNATPFHQVFLSPFLDGAVDPEDIIFQNCMQADLFIWKFFKKGGEGPGKSYKRALTPANSRDTIHRSYAYLLSHSLFSDRLQ